MRRRGRFALRVRVVFRKQEREGNDEEDAAGHEVENLDVGEHRRLMLDHRVDRAERLLLGVSAVRAENRPDLLERVLRLRIEGRHVLGKTRLMKL